MSNKTTSKFLVVSAVVLALGVLPAIAGAAVLLNETFTYPDGNLVGNDGWANHSGTGSFIQVVSGQAILLQGSGSREDANVPFAAQGAAAVTFASFDVSVPSVTTFGAGDYFAHFRNSGSFVYPARVYVGAPLAGGNFTFGVSATATGTTPTVWWGSDFSFGTVHKIVAMYDAATGNSQMWIDPVDQSSTSVISPGGATPPVGDIIDTYALRQGSITTSQQNIDNLVIGQAFCDVIACPTATVSSTWGRIKDSYK